MTTENRMKEISLLLILQNFYDEKMPSSPAVMGVYGINFPGKIKKLHWIMPYKTENSKEIKIVYFNKVKIFLIPFTTSENIIRKFISYLIFELRLFYNLDDLIRIHNYDIIQIRDDPLAGFLSMLVKIKHRIVIVYNRSFPLYQAAKIAYKHEIITTISMTYNLINYLVLRIVLRYVDLILAISNEMQNEMEIYEKVKKKILPFPLGVEPSIFKDNKECINQIIEKYSINNDDFIMIYVGEISKMRSLENVINAYERFQQIFVKSKLLFVGDGDAIDYLKEFCSKLNISNKVTFTGKVPFSMVPSFIKISDVCLSLFYPRACYLVSSPCKLFEYMLMKKPIIANREIPEHKRVINKCKCGILTKYNQKEIFKAMCHMAKLSKLELKDIGQTGYQWVVENRTFDKMTNKIGNEYIKLIDRWNNG